MAEPPEVHVDIPTLRRNYCFLTILVVDTATQLLRELFLRYLKQPTYIFFQCTRIREVIRQLFEQRIIHYSDRDNLLSPDVDVNTFDLSLLHTLLTTFCPEILRPLNGWTIDPDSNDLSIGADLVRLRNFRNRVLAHRPEARISDEEYLQSWEEIKGVILRMARNGLPDREQSFKEQIDSIRTNLFVFYVYLDSLYMHSASASVRHLFAQISTEKQKKQKTATTENKWILLELMRKVPPASPSGVLGRQQETTSEKSSSHSLLLYLKNKDILNVGSKEESKYTDDTWQPEINLKLKILMRYYGFASCPSDAEGNPQKDSSDESSSGQSIYSLEQRLEILQKWKALETAYTEETREFILKSSLIHDKPEMVSSLGPSSAEGSLLKGTSGDPLSGSLTLTLEKRLQILQKCKDQETAYTEETREFILKSGFSLVKPEKVSSVGPSRTEDDSDDTESIESRRSPDDKPSDAVELTKLGTNHADKIIRQMLIQARRFAEEYGLRFLYESDFTELENVNRHVFQISHRNKVLGTAFLFNLFPEGKQYLLTAGHVIAGYDEETVLATEGQFCYPASPVGISSIADVGVLRLKWPFLPMSPPRRPISIDIGTETSTHIYVVGYVSGEQTHQIEECLVLPSRDKDDGFIRFKSRLFSEGCFGSPCLVLKDGQYVVKGMLIGREGGTDTPYELIAITFRCVWKRLGFP